jgi:hypothetical protein
MGLTISVAGVIASQLKRVDREESRFHIGEALQKIASVLILVLGIMLIL